MFEDIRQLLRLPASSIGSVKLDHDEWLEADILRSGFGVVVLMTLDGCCITSGGRGIKQYGPVEVGGAMPVLTAGCGYSC